MFRDMVLQKNKYHQTPLDLMISSDAPIMRLQRLLDFDLLQKNSFDGIEKEIIEFVCQKLIKYHDRINSKKGKDKGKDAAKDKDKRVLSSAKYFKIFHDELEAYKLQQEEFERRQKIDIFDNQLRDPEMDFTLMHNLHLNSRKKQVTRLTRNQANFDSRTIFR